MIKAAISVLVEVEFEDDGETDLQSQAFDALPLLIDKYEPLELHWIDDGEEENHEQ